MSIYPVQTETIRTAVDGENKKTGIFWFVLFVIACFLGALPVFCLSAETDNETFAGGFAPPAPQIVEPQTVPLPPAPQQKPAAMSAVSPAVNPAAISITESSPSAMPSSAATLPASPLPPSSMLPSTSSTTIPLPREPMPHKPIQRDMFSNAANVNNTNINNANANAVKPNVNNEIRKRKEFRQPEIIQAAAAFEPSPEQLKNQPELLRSVADEQHPFRYYYEIPKQPQSLITGKLVSVAELFSGVSSSAARCRLLQKYWELAGLLVEYNIRLDAELMCQKWLNESGGDSQRRNVFSLALNQTQQQRKSTELAFIKAQWQFAEIMKPYQQNITEKDNLPLPSDFPVYKKYETYSGKIAHSERAVLLGHLIPVQEQLLNSKKEESKAADAMIQNTMQQLPQSSPRDLIFTLNQRTETFCGLIAEVVDYNKMIAEYVSETVGSGVSKYRLVSAVIELPKWNKPAINQAR